MFDVISTEMPGCYEIQPRVFNDARGRFVKVFHQDLFAERGLETRFSEEYYSVSHRGVIRGLHFQAPPADHVKLVYCVYGEVFDVVLDLRMGSPTYGKTASFQLSADKGNYIYIPKGLAHGFCATSDVSTLIYKVSTVYAPQCDSGVLWSSIDIEWPTASPIISERDNDFKPFSEFESPFTYEQ
jgi:dTDP-4-dehydrorhamnose 3,5-epimerase